MLNEKDGESLPKLRSYSDSGIPLCRHWKQGMLRLDTYEESQIAESCFIGLIYPGYL